MKVVVTYSSKKGLEKEFREMTPSLPDSDDEPPSTDFFAEGDSMETVNSVMDALRSCGHDVCGFESDIQVQNKLQSCRPDIVFNIAEGLYGVFRESYVPMICEKLRIPYTGSDPMTLAICLHKAKCKEMLTYFGISNPKFVLTDGSDTASLKKLKYPVIVKPNSEGSSKGIFNDSVAETYADAVKKIKKNVDKYDQQFIVEELITGREFTVAIWGNGKDAQVLPIVEINHSELPEDAWPIYSYEAKWIWDTSEKPLDIFKCPADIGTTLRKKIEETVLKAYSALEIKDWCRIDVRLDSKGIPNILEINPLPGILPKPEDNSCFPKAARTAGYPYSKMLGKIVRTAARRYGLK